MSERCRQTPAMRHPRRPRRPLARYAYTYVTLSLLAVECSMPHVLGLGTLLVVLKFNDFTESQRRAYFVFYLQINVQFTMSNILGS